MSDGMNYGYPTFRMVLQSRGAASRQTDVLTRFLNCRTGNRPLAYDCRLSPGVYQLQQELLLFFGFGLGP
jgi:hypothetical protein